MTNKEKKQIVTEMFEDDKFFVGEIMACNESRESETWMLVIICTLLVMILLITYMTLYHSLSYH